MFNSLDTWFRRQPVARTLTTTPLTTFAVGDLHGDHGGAESAAGGPVTFDEDALRRRLSGDDELMTDIIGLFLEDLPVRLAAIQDALTRKDADALRAAAHTLKGSAGNLSADRLLEAAHALEGIAAESHLDAAEAAWRRLSVEASQATDALRRHAASVKHPHRVAS
jgi:HPt (histidine-containing phosphotransfer) domain-containing protein